MTSTTTPDHDVDSSESSAEGVRVCFATVRDNAKYGNQLIAFHDAPPPSPEEGVRVVRARVRYAKNGNIRLWEILPNIPGQQRPLGAVGCDGLVGLSGGKTTE